MHLTKHHAAGNDFLVLVDPGRAEGLDAGTARALCDRRLGVGADGLLRCSTGRDGADLEMELWNADGSPAEMSGNGIRCLVQAAVLEGLVRPGTVAVATAAGLRHVDYRGGGTDHSASATVEMGAVRLGDAVEVGLGEAWARMADAGNPHVVVAVDGGRPPIAEAGAELQRLLPGGINVEVIAPAGPDRLTLEVFERGVGVTLACGTGTCAAAVAARAAGMVGDVVVVDNPGGALTVSMEGERVELGGPTQFVAALDVDPADLTGGRP